MKVKKVSKTRNFSPAKAEKCLTNMIEVLQKHKLTVGELLIVLGNLGYMVGASIDKYGEKGPNVEELKKLYYTNPTVGVALMLNGLTISTWYDDWEKTQKETREKS